MRDRYLKNISFSRQVRNPTLLAPNYLTLILGVFMALITAVVLLGILGVGIRGLASLEVPYAAFEKEMGPTAQKKQP